MRLSTVREPAVMITAAALLIATALAWWSLLRPREASLNMQTPMPGMAMEAPAMSWSGLLTYVAAWSIMMAAMMLPSALPMIALYAKTSQTRWTVASFALVYMIVWSAAGIPAYVVGIAIQRLAMANAAVAAALPYALAVTVVLAGAYQFSPLKYRCLHMCRNPIAFLLGGWRAGWWGALQLGFEHAAYCLGCCAALMVVLLAAGAMSLPWVLAITVVIFAEKVSPFGARAARLSGAALIALGIKLAVQ